MYYIKNKFMKHQGDSAELRFMLLNHELGYIVSKPFGDNDKYYLTSSGMDCYNCLVCSGADAKQQYSDKDIDYVAIYVIPENAWYKIPVKEIKGKTVKLYPHRKSQKNTYEKYRI
jgi:hypothetical protein